MAITSLAREAIYECNLALAECRTSVAGVLVEGNGESRLGSRAFSPGRRTYEYGLMRMMQIAEDASTVMLLRKRDEVAAKLGSNIGALWALADYRIDKWSGRKELWTALVPALTFDGPSRWAELQAGAFVRNVLAHGGGTMNQSQLRDAGKQSQNLRKLGVSVVGHRLALSADSVELCRNVVRDFVLWLDSR